MEVITSGPTVNTTSVLFQNSKEIVKAVVASAMLRVVDMAWTGAGRGVMLGRPSLICYGLARVLHG